MDKTSRLEFNRSGKADFAVVVNYSRGLHFVWGKKLRLIKWLMEPEVKNRLTHLFTWGHSKIYDEVYCHNARQNEPREIRMPPLVPPHVEPKEVGILMRNKEKLVSAIGSREISLPLHKERTALLDYLEDHSSELNVDVFGKGRRYIESKSEGLDPYLYSIAIENSEQPNYWTEKISDCFLSMTVPIYRGAPNIFSFFHPESVIRMEGVNLESSAHEVLASISRDDYLRRVPHLLDAREKLMGHYSFGRVVAELALAQQPEQPSARRIFSRIWGLDTIISLLVTPISAGIQLLRKLPALNRKFL